MAGVTPGKGAKSQSEEGSVARDAMGGDGASVVALFRFLEFTKGGDGLYISLSDPHSGPDRHWRGWRDSHPRNSSGTEALFHYIPWDPDFITDPPDFFVWSVYNPYVPREISLVKSFIPCLS